MTDTLKKTYIACANGLGLGDLTKVNAGPERVELINKCADGYIESTEKKNEVKRSQYISALMLLFWAEIGKMADKCKAVSEYEYEDFATQLYKCIETACGYHAWKDGKHNAEQCIRAVIASRGAAAILYESNLDKNKSNVNICSLDSVIDEDSEKETTRLDLLEDDSANNYIGDLRARLVIQKIVDNGDLLDSIILDNLAFGDSIKTTKETKVEVDDETGEEYKYTTSSSEFSERLLVSTLSNLPNNYKADFMKKYNVNEGAVDAAIKRIKAVNSTKLYTYIHAALSKQQRVLAN